MEAEFSLAYLTCGALEPPAQTYTAANAGYEYVSYRPIPMGLPSEPALDLANDPQLLRDTKQALKDTGVKVHDIELARCADDSDPARWDAGFAIGEELGARAVISSVWTTNKNKQVEDLGTICELARKHGLFVGLEFVPISAVTTLQETVDLLKTVNAPNAGLLLDMYHVSRSGTRPEDLDDLPREWFRFCHLCDTSAEMPHTIEELRTEVRERRLYVGEGGVNVAAYLERLPQMVCSIELPHLQHEHVFGYTEHAARCLESARTYFREHHIWSQE